MEADLEVPSPLDDYESTTSTGDNLRVKAELCEARRDAAEPVECDAGFTLPG